MKKFNTLLKEIIEDEERFIEDLYEDNCMSEEDCNERISILNEELNTCTTVEDVVCWFINQGYSQNEAYQHVFKYLVEEV